MKFNIPTCDWFCTDGSHIIIYVIYSEVLLIGFDSVYGYKQLKSVVITAWDAGNLWDVTGDEAELAL